MWYLRVMRWVCFVCVVLLTPFVYAQENVVLIIVDACREDCLDITRNDVPLMPFLSNFPAIRFRNASSAAAWTRPSMSSIFTSTHVDTHQIHEFSRFLPESAETMAEYLKSAGYTTLAIQTNGVVSAESGFSQGFDVFLLNKFAPADWVSETALTLVEGIPGPFFLYLHYNQPHVPYFPPLDYRTMLGYPPVDITPYEQEVAENVLPYQIDYLRYNLGLQPTLTYEPLSAVGCDAIRSLYDGEVRFNDDQLEVLLNTLLSEHPDTIVIVTSDHGEHFWEHDAVGHGTTAYEELFDVPFIIHIPEVPASSDDTIVSTLDILPTIANRLGLPLRVQWEGRDMFGERDPDGPVYANTKYEADWLLNLEAIRWGDMKLIRNYTTRAVELYDLSSDPEEIVNLAASQPSTCQMMTTMLHQHLLNNARTNGPDSTLIPFPGRMEQGNTVCLTAPAGIGHVWFKNGIPLLEDGEGITGTDTRTLVISTLTSFDAATYECMYNDEAFSLNVTTPYDLNVLPENTVPASSAFCLLLLVILLIMLSLSLMKGNSQVVIIRNLCD